MKKLFFIVIISGYFLSDCSHALQENPAKENATFIIEHIDDKDIIKYFPEKYFPKNKTEAFLKELNNHCNKASRNGGFKDSDWVLNLTANDRMLFYYDYQYDCGPVRFTLNYEISQDTFMLVSMNMNILR